MKRKNEQVNNTGESQIGIKGNQLAVTTGVLPMHW